MIVRILITSTGAWGTGSFTLIDAIIKELMELGHQVKVIFPDANLETADKKAYYSKPELFHVWPFPIACNGFRLDSFPLMIPDPHPLNPEAKTFKELSQGELQCYFESFSNEIKKVINDFKPDIIECQHIWAMDHVIANLGHAFINVAHHSDQMGFHYDDRMRPMTIDSAQKAKFIFAISDNVKDEVCELYHVAPEKVIVIENGYDKAVFKPFHENRKNVLKDLGINTIPPNATIISFSGKVSKTKGIDIILKANQYLKNHPIHFIIAGAGTRAQAMELAVLNDKGFDNLHFIGHQTPTMLSRIHNVSALNIMPSRTEGFGIACLEAMACGLPVVVSATGGPDAYAVGEVVPVEDAEGLAKGIDRILDLPKDQYQQLSQEALTTAGQFSWENNVAKRLDYYSRAQTN